jgi:hypothetical protein
LGLIFEKYFENAPVKEFWLKEVQKKSSTLKLSISVLKMPELDKTYHSNKMPCTDNYC